MRDGSISDYFVRLQCRPVGAPKLPSRALNMRGLILTF